MRIPVLLTSFILFVTLPVLSRAETGSIMLKDLEQEALKNNPEIHMAEKKVESAQEKKSLASAMPDPMIGYERQNVGSFGSSTIGKEEMSMQGIVFSQEIPFPGKRGTRGKSAGKQAEREQENSRETRLRVLNDLRAAYYDYYLAYKSSGILEQNKEIMKNFQRIAETRYSTGQGIQQDVIRAQLEVSMLLERIAREEQKKEAQRAMVNRVLGRNPSAPLGNPADIIPNTMNGTLDSFMSMAVEHSPVVLAKQRMLEQSKFELSSSKREYLPDSTLSVGWFDRGGFKDVWQASIMFKVPLYFWNKAAGVRSAAADLSAARYDYEASKLMTLSRMRDLYTTAKTSERLLSLYETGILPQARMALQSSSSAYQVGKVDFQALLESRNVLLKYELSYQEELVTLNKTVAMIEETAGMEHENDKVKIQNEK